MNKKTIETLMKIKIELLLHNHLSNEDFKKDAIALQKIIDESLIEVRNMNPLNPKPIFFTSSEIYNIERAIVAFVINARYEEELRKEFAPIGEKFKKAMEGIRK
ncbi:MAG: hypothetical protein ACTSYF_03630 [Promethearchaeota archaeon]